MHEVIVQVCFVMAGLVNACTTGVVYTDHPTLVEQVAPVVYVENAPRQIISYYSLFSVPIPVVQYRRSYRTRGIYIHPPHQYIKSMFATTTGRRRKPLSINIFIISPRLQSQSSRRQRRKPTRSDDTRRGIDEGANIIGSVLIVMRDIRRPIYIREPSRALLG